MTIYEIDSAIAALVDPETGEIADFEAFEALNMERETKIENMLCLYKNLVYEASAMKEEEQKLHERRGSIENQLKSLKNYIEAILGGQAWKSPKAAASFRNYSVVECDDGFVDWAKNNAPQLLRIPAPEANKTAINKAIKDGQDVEHVTMVQRRSMTVK